MPRVRPSAGPGSPGMLAMRACTASTRSVRPVVASVASFAAPRRARACEAASAAVGPSASSSAESGGLCIERAGRARLRVGHSVPALDVCSACLPSTRRFFRASVFTDSRPIVTVFGNRLRRDICGRFVVVPGKQMAIGWCVRHGTLIASQKHRRQNSNVGAASVQVAVSTDVPFSVHLRRCHFPFLPGTPAPSLSSGLLDALARVGMNKQGAHCHDSRFPFSSFTSGLDCRDGDAAALRLRR